jgi:hypothetical protein
MLQAWVLWRPLLRRAGLSDTAPGEIGAGAEAVRPAPILVKGLTPHIEFAGMCAVK